MKTFATYCQRFLTLDVLFFPIVLSAASFSLALVSTADAERMESELVSQWSTLKELNLRVLAGIERAKPACVAVSTRPNGHAGFSAVIATEEGYVLTAAHCIEPNRDYYLHLDGGRKIKAKSLGRSRVLDIGLMRIVEDVPFPFVEMGRSGDLVRNQPCLSISHPGGYNADRGLVTRFGRVLDFNHRGHIQNTCLMEPGDSGGGLFDLDGRVIGVHAYIRKSLDQNYDMPVDDFRTYWDQLCEPRNFTPPFAADRFGINMKSTDKAEIESIVEGSPADQAGLEADDLILQINGNQWDADSPLDRQLRRSRSRRSRSSILLVQRGDEELSIRVDPRLPEPPTMKRDESNQYHGWSDLAAVLADVEEDLDDLTVRIDSDFPYETQTVYGTVIDEQGMILSKSSCVGESPIVTDCEDRELTGNVLWRDETNDLVLIAVDSTFEKSVDLEHAASIESGLLLLPRPGELTGLTSVVGSSRFTSPQQKQYGFLGVRPSLQEDRVVLLDVMDGPAKHAELKQMDAILRVGDVPIDSVSKLVNTIRSHPPGNTVKITIERESQEKLIEVVLGASPSRTSDHIAFKVDGGFSVRRTGFEKIYCHDSHATPTECGGPLFDLEGNFVGINIARQSRTHCYALPADVIRKSIERNGSL